MSKHESSLPEAWVTRIFTALRATYGVAFDRLWECPPCPPGHDPKQHVHEHYEGMKAHWGRELAGYQRNPGAIAHALGNLPETPPNLPQFKALLLRAPPPPVPALEAPAPDPARVAEALTRARAAGGVADPRGWAVRILARAARGERVPHGQLEMARRAATGSRGAPV